MSGTNTSEDVVECPLCMEPLEVDDLNFFPCTCGYQICRFCWHRIRTDENELCPACRKEYPENPADFTPLTQEEMIAFKSQKRQRDQQRKQRITENRKHLANVRVVQKNLVFVVGLPPRLADADILKKHEYFGKYGKIHKVVINPSTAYAGVQGPSASAYVTYINNNDALRAIQSVNNINIDGRLIKTSLGTTKYCSHFMKNQQCPKTDCMYLHELGDPEASFTKEEMHQGKHQEYEKKLHDVLLSNTISANGGIQSNSFVVSNSLGVGNVPLNQKSSNPNTKTAQSTNLTTSSTISNLLGVNISSIPTNMTSRSNSEVWPSLSVSPSNKDNTILNSKVKKDKSKSERAKNEKIGKSKSRNNNTSKISAAPYLSQSKEIDFDLEGRDSIQADSNLPSISSKVKIDKAKIKPNQKQNKDTKEINEDNEAGTISNLDDKNIDFKIDNVDNNIFKDLNNLSESRYELRSKNGEICERSNSLSSTISDSSVSERVSIVSESNSGKSSPGNVCLEKSDVAFSVTNSSKASPSTEDSVTNISNDGLVDEINVRNSPSKDTILWDLDKSNQQITGVDVPTIVPTSKNPNSAIENLSLNLNSVPNLCNTPNFNNPMDPTLALSKLNLCDESNSFFSSSASTTNVLHPSSILKFRDSRSNNLNSVISSHLPDLLNGVDGYQNNTQSNEWEEAFRSVLISKQMEELQKQKVLQQQHQIQLHHQEEFLRFQDLQKRNILHSMHIAPITSSVNDYINISSNGVSSNTHDINRLGQNPMIQQQIFQHQQTPVPQHSSENLIDSNMFGTNMSKFFDFHKTQQQQQLQQASVNLHGNSSSINPLTDNMRVSSYMENNRLNSQCIEANSLLPSQQQILQSQRAITKLDSVPQIHMQMANQKLNPHQQQPQVSQSCQQQQYQQHNRVANPFSINGSVDDDLGFDPFIETQKGLAELMENEVAQQNANVNKAFHRQHQQRLLENIQRARMPPPGFNHVTSHHNFNSGVSRIQTSSKMFPYVNIPTTMNSTPPVLHQQQQQNFLQGNSWNVHLNTYQQQKGVSNDLSVTCQNNMNQKVFSNNDWTAMDPAILSLRQFPSFAHQNSIPHHPQQELFLQHLSQQQNSQGINIYQ